MRADTRRGGRRPPRGPAGTRFIRHASANPIRRNCRRCPHINIASHYSKHSDSSPRQTASIARLPHCHDNLSRIVMGARTFVQRIGGLSTADRVSKRGRPDRRCAEVSSRRRGGWTTRHTRGTLAERCSSEREGCEGSVPRRWRERGSASSKRGVSFVSHLQGAQRRQRCLSSAAAALGSLAFDTPPPRRRRTPSVSFPSTTAWCAPRIACSSCGRWPESSRRKRSEYKEKKSGRGSRHVFAHTLHHQYERTLCL